MTKGIFTEKPEIYSYFPLDNGMDKRIKLLKHMLGIINVQNTTVDLIVDCIEHTNSILDILKEKDKSIPSA